MTHQPHSGTTGPATDFNPIQIRDAVRRLLEAEELPAIVQAGHPVLRQLAAPYDGQLDDVELAALIDRMRDAMHAAPGVGLAAPQLGIPLQLAVVEDKYEIDPASATVRHREPLDFFALVNPTYRPLGAETAAFYEGCLSVQGYQAVVARPRNVELSYSTPAGAPVEEWFSGWQARIVQHETDHLHGTLYLDRAELRSLASNAEHSARWASPDVEDARRSLGFLL
ncbi:peptide deformylase [Paenarthrobacter nitroguajacolicus]|uniref:peptide deformylase n=1 Tax=Paenarthrobacter nitroguajacolicus TaxID=211146 RepID=UPI00248C2CCB|nr:peptide deformylase [Paenarthrobacter nitroguajacolicus]MDI2033962.1 Peptide deformylase [Paenarthrobacter nitroguajacolicus]